MTITHNALYWLARWEVAISGLNCETERVTAHIQRATKVISPACMYFLWEQGS